MYCTRHSYTDRYCYHMWVCIAAMTLFVVEVFITFLFYHSSHKAEHERCTANQQFFIRTVHTAALTAKRQPVDR